jgi:hypothetical protein
LTPFERFVRLWRIPGGNEACASGSARSFPDRQAMPADPRRTAWHGRVATGSASYVSAHVLGTGRPLAGARVGRTLQERACGGQGAAASRIRRRAIHDPIGPLRGASRGKFRWGVRILGSKQWWKRLASPRADARGVSRVPPRPFSLARGPPLPTSRGPCLFRVFNKAGLSLSAACAAQASEAHRRRAPSAASPEDCAIDWRNQRALTLSPVALLRRRGLHPIFVPTCASTKRGGVGRGGARRGRRGAQRLSGAGTGSGERRHDVGPAGCGSAPAREANEYILFFSKLPGAGGRDAEQRARATAAAELGPPGPGRVGWGGWGLRVRRYVRWWRWW